MKKGMAHCRLFLGFDGCHLFSLYKGILLSTIAMDANSQQFPVCFAVIKNETKDSWIWFLTHVVETLGILECGWTFMSDKQKVTQ